jgi:hypothetical protein
VQRIEVRAWGCLLEELLAHCDAPPSDMIDLAAACLSETPAARPLFEEIVNRLHPGQSRPI